MGRREETSVLEFDELFVQVVSVRRWGEVDFVEWPRLALSNHSTQVGQVVEPMFTVEFAWNSIEGDETHTHVVIDDCSTSNTQLRLPTCSGGTDATEGQRTVGVLLEVASIDYDSTRQRFVLQSAHAQ